MEIEELVHIKEFYSFLIEFIDDEENDDAEIDVQKFQKIQIKDILNLLSKIIKNHHRNQYFFDQIEKIILFLKDKITKIFSNEDLFKIFKNNKRIILFLANNGMIHFDENIINYMKKKDEKNKNSNYLFYFYPEIKNLIDEEEKKLIEEKLFPNYLYKFDDFDKKRKIGENDSYISQLIRSDSIVEFVQFVNKTNYSLTSKIEVSIFETNSFLIKNEPSLIEYSAFYGSIQIFQYLQINNVILKPSLWLYVIHGHNAEIVHLLEQNKIIPEDKTYEECLMESIKCHHNDFAQYFQNNYLINENKIYDYENNFESNIASYIFNNYNYSYFPESINNFFVFCYLCKYDYFELVKILYEYYYDDIKNKMPKRFNFPPINLAADKNNHEIVLYFLKKLGKVIESNYFQKCKNMRKILIPFFIKKIAKGAFKCCESLKQIIFDDNLSLEIIEENAFEKCESLTFVSLPPSIKKIGNYVFSECSDLKKIVIRSSLKKIPDYFFNECFSLAEISIPKSVTRIGQCAFYGCSELKEISLPSTLTYIGDSAFYGCSELKEISLPSTLTYIGEHAFGQCSSLVLLSIPLSVSEIGVGAFSECKS